MNKAPQKELNSEIRDPELFMAMDDLELVAQGVVEGALSGGHKSKFIGFSNEFDSHRNYILGDDLRHVNWNLWAKTDRLYVKQYEAETNIHLYLLIDQSRSMLAQNGSTSKWQYAARAAAAVAYMSLRNRDAVGLYPLQVDMQEFLPPMVKTGHLQQLIAILEASNVEEEVNLQSILSKLPDLFNRRGIVVLFSDLLDNEDELIECLDRFKQDGQQVIVFQTLDPLELSLTDIKNQIELIALEGGKKRRLNVKQIEKNYRLVVDRWQQKIKERLKGIGVDIVTTTTNDPLKNVLIDYLLKRTNIN